MRKHQLALAIKNYVKSLAPKPVVVTLESGKQVTLSPTQALLLKAAEAELTPQQGLRLQSRNSTAQ